MNRILTGLLLLLALLPLYTCEEFGDWIKGPPKCGALISNEYSRSGHSGLFRDANLKLHELECLYNPGIVTGYSQLMYSVRIDSVCCENEDINAEFSVEMLKIADFTAEAQSWHGTSINTWPMTSTADEFMKKYTTKRSFTINNDYKGLPFGYFTLKVILNFPFQGSYVEDTTYCFINLSGIDIKFE